MPSSRSEARPQRGSTTAAGASADSVGLVDRLFAPISIAPLVYFRVACGALLVWLVCIFFNYRGLDQIYEYFIGPSLHFTYPGFDWVKPLPGRGMYILFFGLGLAAALVTVGLGYRVAAAAFFLGFTYVFLLEKARYLNHYYLVCLVALLLAVVPAHRSFSLDVLLRPSLRAATVPAWTLWLLRFQFGVVYFFAGLAKCHADWIDGTIIRLMFADKTGLPVIGDLLTQPWLAVAFSWGGLLLDLLAFPLLLWRRTRLPMLVLVVVFHVMNSQLFAIDIFPWMMIAASVILFFPDRLPWFDRPDASAHGPAGGAAAQAASEAAAASATATAEIPPVARPLGRGRKLTLAFLAAYVAMQTLMPLRHVVYADDGDWTEEGQIFAWRMLMTYKYALPPRFPVTYRRAGRLVKEDLPVPAPGDTAFWVTHWQFRKMAIDPDMILQYCHWRRDQLVRAGCDQIDIRAEVAVSLNGREPRPMIDPGVNLAEEPRRLLTAYPWILPLDAPPARGTASDAAR